MVDYIYKENVDLILKRKKKDEGPFKANRILNTSEVKVDQVFAKEDEKPVAFFITNTEDEVRRIGAKGYGGPTQVGAEGKYERDKKWVTRAIYFPKNIPGAEFDKDISRQIRESLMVEGTVVPADIQFERVKDEKTYPISGTAVLRTGSDGYAEISGSFPVSIPIMKLCPGCGCEIYANAMECPICGRANV